MQEQAINEYYQNAKEGVQQTAGKALQQAYIQNKLQNRDLAQNLAGYGTSGMSESSRIALASAYENARGDIEQEKIARMASLDAARGQELNQAGTAYQEALQKALQNQASGALQAAALQQKEAQQSRENLLSGVLSIKKAYQSGQLSKNEAKQLAALYGFEALFA